MPEQTHGQLPKDSGTCQTCREAEHDSGPTKQSQKLLKHMGYDICTEPLSCRKDKIPQDTQFLVYSSCGHIACAYGLPATLLSRGPLQHNIHSEPLMQNTHTLSLSGCQGPQVVVPSLWVPYLPTISLVYWSFLHWILVTCSPKANAISV